MNELSTVPGDAGERGGRSPSPDDGPSLLLVDDDAPLRRSLERAMERRGFQVLAAESLKEGLNLAHSSRLEYAVVDLRLEEGHV